jgi:hypothetical protein
MGQLHKHQASKRKEDLLLLKIKILQEIQWPREVHCQYSQFKEIITS